MEAVMFVGREKELASLEKLYQKEKFHILTKEEYIDALNNLKAT